jgi:hypothetical protein
VPRPAFASFSEEGGGLARIHIKDADRGLEHLEAKNRWQNGGRSLVATEREVLIGAFRMTKVKVVAEREQVGEGKVVFEAGPLAHVWLNDPHATRGLCESERHRHDVPAARDAPATREKATAGTTSELHRSAISASFGRAREGSTGWTPSTAALPSGPAHPNGPNSPMA